MQCSSLRDERFFLVKETLCIHLEQEDVTRYILLYYTPLLNAELERMKIEWLYGIKPKGSIDYCNDRLYQTMIDRDMLLDPRIRDNRLERLLSFVENSYFSPRYTKLVGLFFWRAYQYDCTFLMRLLRIHNFLYSVPLDNIPLLLREVDDFCMSEPSWYSTATTYKYFAPLRYIILYCLDQKIEEPILKWITFKDVKGGNLVKCIITKLDSDKMIKPSEKAYYEKLCMKQKSEEWREKRKNVILYKQYK